jgi:glycerol-3-phosphate dehydrogenase
MHTWFECKIKYEKNADEGKIVKVAESYLVDALSFTEAEARIIEEMTPFISGEFQVSNVRRARINELFYDETGDLWYRAKIVFVLFDEEKQVEKEVPATMFVQASSFKNALDGIEKGLKGSMADYRIILITESPVIDVYRFKDMSGEA